MIDFFQREMLYAVSMAVSMYSHTHSHTHTVRGLSPTLGAYRFGKRHRTTRSLRLLWYGCSLLPSFHPWHSSTSLDCPTFVTMFQPSHAQPSTPADACPAPAPAPPTHTHPHTDTRMQPYPRTHTLLYTHMPIASAPQHDSDCCNAPRETETHWCHHPHTLQVMARISNATYDVTQSPLVMAMLWKRLNDMGKHWRHCYKVCSPRTRPWVVGATPPMV